MPARLRSIAAIARRALRQLALDRRFLVLSFLAPLVIIYFVKLFFDGLASPLFNPASYVVPVGAFIVHFITYLLCAIALVRERTARTLDRMFISGYRSLEIISGYLLAYTLLATVQSLLVLGELRLLFALSYSAKTFAALYLVIWLLALISISLGMFISTFARNEGQVVPFIPLVIVPSIFLSGLLISVDRLPWAARLVSYLTPLYYANLAIQALITPGARLDNFWSGLARLAVYGAALVSLAALTLRETE